jgi:hypothetical protein
MPSSPTAYTITVGDKLRFSYSSSHNVWKMSSASKYEACDFGGGTELAGTTYGGGSGSTANIYEAVVTTAGTLYIACEQGSHCSAGQQKVVITVEAAPLPPGTSCSQPCGQTCASAAQAVFQPGSTLSDCVEISGNWHDTELDLSDGTTNLGAVDTVEWDGPMPPGGKSSGGSFVMLKVSTTSLTGTHISKAHLWYYVSESGHEAEAHEVKTSWDEGNVTYASLPAGSTLPGGAPGQASNGMPSDVPSSQRVYNLPGGSGPLYPSEAGAITRYNSPVVGKRVGYADGSFGWNWLDVTSSMRDFASGASQNNGWIFLPTGGTSGTAIRTSEYTGPDGSGPKLYVTTSSVAPRPPPPMPPAPPPPPPLSTVIIGPEDAEDTFISSHRADRNFNSDASLYVGSPGSGSGDSSYGGAYLYGLLKFAFGKLSASDHILHADLWYYVRYGELRAATTTGLV